MSLDPSEDLRRLGVDPSRVKPGELIWRLSGDLNSLIDSGAASWADPNTIELRLNEEESAGGGHANVNLNRAIRCRSCADGGNGCKRCDGKRQFVERVSVWLKIPAAVANGTELDASIWPVQWVEPLKFRLVRD